jgi:hypothetical protein
VNCQVRNDMSPSVYRCNLSRMHPGRVTLEPYRRCSGRQSPARAGMPGAGRSSIRPFQVSRWCLRRTRDPWVFNAVLELPYCLSAGIPSCLGLDLRSTGMIVCLWALGSEVVPGTHPRARPLRTSSVRRARGLLETRYPEKGPTAQSDSWPEQPYPPAICSRGR